MCKKVVLSLCFAAISSVAFSQSSTDSNLIEHFGTENDTVKKKGQMLQEVIITPEHKTPAQIGRAAIDPMDLPQSIQVVGSETIKEQQPIRLSEVVKNINGVYVSSARGGAQESFYARGYDMSGNNMYKNGFRVSSGSMPEVAALEKVEVLKGGAALLFGNVTPGGILNLVTKAPQFKKGGTVEMQAGSYSFYKPAVDFYGPISSNVAYRFIGNYENSESFRDVVTRQRVYANPSALFRAGAKTEILLQADYLYDDWTPDFGTGSVGNEVADIPRSKYLGAHWSNGITKQASVSGLVTHKFNSNWRIDFNSSFQDYDRESKGTERIQPAENGDFTVQFGQNKSSERILAEQINFQGTFKTGSIKHQLLAGVDYENSLADAYTYAFPTSTPIVANIYTFDGAALDEIPTARNSRIVKTNTDRFGAYFQDLISVTTKFKVLAGLRWSWQQATPKTWQFDEETTITPGEKKIDKAFSPKVGLIYQPDNTTSLFASYSNSFTPNTGITNDAPAGKPLEASIIDQYEVGIKKEFLNKKLTTNITVYQITNSNFAQTAEFLTDGTPNTLPTVKILSGETTSKGVEIDILATPIERMKLMAGYSYNDMRYTKTNAGAGSFYEGDRLVRTPQHTANLSAFYTFAIGNLDGFSIGTIGNYIGERLAGWNNTVGHANPDREIPLSDYTTIDVSAGYRFKQFSILCRLSNITNVLNYTVHENYSVNPTAPRQVLTSLKYSF